MITGSLRQGYIDELISGVSVIGILKKNNRKSGVQSMTETARGRLSFTKMMEIVLFIIYKAFFNVFFTRVYSEVFGQTLHRSGEKDVIGWIVYLIIVFLAVNYLNGYYSIAYKFLFIFAGMTTNALYELRDISHIDFWKAETYWFMLLFFCMLLSKENSFKASKVKDSSHKGGFQLVVLALSVGSAFLLSGILTRFRFTLSFDDVYAYRLEMRATQLPGYVRYLFVLVGGVLLPYCFAYFLTKKSYILSALALLGGILIFSINGMKTWLLVYVLIGLVFLAHRINKDHLMVYILIFMTLWMAVSWFEYHRCGEVGLLGLVGRTIYIPSQIGYNFIAFFDANEYLYLRESVLRFLFDSPYPYGSEFFIVGGYSTTIGTARANNGLWGDAYANFAYVGMLVYPFLLAVVLRGLVRTMDSYEERFTTAIVCSLLWTAINASFFTWLVTGGVVVVMLINVLGQTR